MASELECRNVEADYYIILWGTPLSERISYSHDLLTKEGAVISLSADMNHKTAARTFPSVESNPAHILRITQVIKCNPKIRAL